MKRYNIYQNLRGIGLGMDFLGQLDEAGFHDFVEEVLDGQDDEERKGALEELAEYGWLYDYKVEVV